MVMPGLAVPERGACWNNCRCQKLGVIQPECVSGMFPPFHKLPCGLSIERLVFAPEALSSPPTRSRFACTSCGRPVTRNHIRCRKCKASDNRVALCLI
jgi:hypothetical protein